MKVLTVSEMKCLEEKCTAEFGYSTDMIIETVGIRGADLIFDYYIVNEMPSRIILLLGCGNNAADALAIGRVLTTKGLAVEAIFLIDKNPTDAFRKQVKLAEAFGVFFHEQDVNLEEILEEENILFIDGVYGVGFKDALPDSLHSVFEQINSSSNCIIAIDLPSGVFADTGKADPNTLLATATLAIEHFKPGHFFDKGAIATGELHVISANFPATLTSAKGINVFEISPECSPVLMNERAHKYDQGSTLIIGGSRGLTGAPVLASTASTFMGIGITGIYTDDDVMNEIVSIKPYSTVLHCEMPDLKKVSAILIGCGWGKKDISKKRAMIRKVSASSLPLVVDADAISSLDLEFLADAFKNRSAPTILTPHLGELSTLAGRELSEYEASRLIQELATKHKIYILLKSGPLMLLATKDGELYLTMNPNSALAKAGTGDILAGLIVGALAKNPDEDLLLLTEMVLSKFIAAGRAISDEQGSASVIAEDLLHELKMDNQE